MLTIGLPRGLFYFQHHVLWESFFKNLGCSVVVSPDTNREILDLGVKYSSNENCLPVKVFIGHVRYLKDKADYIFIPRYTSLDRNEYACPKFCGLPEIAKYSVEGIKLIEVRFHIDKGPGETFKSLMELSRILNCKYSDVLEAFRQAVEQYVKSIRKPGEYVFEGDDGCIQNITLLGHPYMIYDSFISMRLAQKLQHKGYRVYTPSDLDYETRRKNAHPYQNRVFWQVGIDNLGSAFTYAVNKNIKGIVYLTPFGCGVDSFVTEFIERKFASGGDISYLKLTIDEHTGETGFDTRIEAFLDMLGL